MLIGLLFIVIGFTYGFLAGLFSFEKLVKENVLKDEEIEKWKKWLFILGIIVIVLFIIFAIVNYFTYMPIQEPFYHDAPPYPMDSNIRLALGDFNNFVGSVFYA